MSLVSTAFIELVKSCSKNLIPLKSLLHQNGVQRLHLLKGALGGVVLAIRKERGSAFVCQFQDVDTRLRYVILSKVLGSFHKVAVAAFLVKSCVRCVWPIRSRHSTTSKNRSWCWHVFHSPRTGLTRWSLLFVQESHCCCHFNKTVRRIVRWLSFKGIFIVVMCFCAAKKAHSSAFSLPGIPM